MDRAYRQACQGLNLLKVGIKQKLLEMQQIDKECLRLQLKIDLMQKKYFQEEAQLQQADMLTADQEEITENKICEMYRVLKNLSQKKVEVADELVNMVQDQGGQINDSLIEKAKQNFHEEGLTSALDDYAKYNFGLKKRRGRQKAIKPQIQEVYSQYYEQQKPKIQVNKKYCICKPNQDLQNPDLMIECENPNCPVGWYHFECMKLQNFEYLGQWFCPDCLKNMRKSSQERQNQMVFQSILEEAEDDQPPKKRGPGRPRKIIEGPSD